MILRVYNASRTPHIAHLLEMNEGFSLGSKHVGRVAGWRAGGRTVKKWAECNLVQRWVKVREGCRHGDLIMWVVEGP